MKRLMIATLLPMLLLTGCASAGQTVQEAEEYKRPTVEEAETKIRTYFEEKGFEVVDAERYGNDGFAAIININSWDLPSGGMSVYFSAEEDDPTLLLNFSINIIDYATFETFTNTEVLCDRFKINEYCSDLVNMFSPSTGPDMTPEDIRTLMQQIIDQVENPRGGNMYHSQIIKECPFSTWLNYDNLSAYGQEWTLSFDCWFDEKHGC